MTGFVIVDVTVLNRSYSTMEFKEFSVNFLDFNQSGGGRGRSRIGGVEAGKRRRTWEIGREEEVGEATAAKRRREREESRRRGDERNMELPEEARKGMLQQLRNGKLQVGLRNNLVSCKLLKNKEKDKKDLTFLNPKQGNEVLVSREEDLVERRMNGVEVEVGWRGDEKRKKRTWAAGIDRKSVV